METDPLGPSATFSSSEAEKRNNSNEETANYAEPPDPLDFICFVCNNEFDDMAKLHVHMSMKHKGIKVNRFVNPVGN